LETKLIDIAGFAKSLGKNTEYATKYRTRNWYKKNMKINKIDTRLLKLNSKNNIIGS